MYIGSTVGSGGRRTGETVIACCWVIPNGLVKVKNKKKNTVNIHSDDAVSGRSSTIRINVI